MNREIIKKLIRPFVGQTWQQAFYEKLYLLSLVGMNYAIGGDLKFSGEYQLLKRLAKKIPKDKPIHLFDVGGNMGDYSKAYCQVFAKHSFMVHTFEPSKSTYTKLNENLKSLKESNKIQLNNFGLSDKAGNLTLYSSTEEMSGTASVYQRNVPAFDLVLDKTEPIQLSTIDEYCLSNNIHEIAMLKMDVEGHEFSVLKGAKKMLNEGRIGHIQFEFGGCNLDSRTNFRDFYELLKPQYEIYRVLADGIRKLGTYDEIMHEIFTAINFVAIKK